jgi:glucan biosynthesis protein
MNRRRFLKSSMAVAAVCGTSGVASLFSQAAFAEDAGIADGQTRRFDYAVLQAMAHDLARQPWGGAPRDLPPTLANLTPQAYNSIQYDANHSLWNNIEERKLDIQFFHVGMGFRRRVRMFSLDAATQQAREIHFRPELFKYNDAGWTPASWKDSPTSASPGSGCLKRRSWRAAISWRSSAPATSAR